jgi:Xaa-Pro aminopeptidase
MTAPMTPRDPFTDEAKKVRALMLGKPLEEQWQVIADALLAGTERLRAQGTWNEAIEAAAGVAETFAARTETRTGHELGDGPTQDAIADEIRALKRPEAP